MPDLRQSRLYFRAFRVFRSGLRGPVQRRGPPCPGAFGGPVVRSHKCRAGMPALRESHPSRLSFRVFCVFRSGLRGLGCSLLVVSCSLEASLCNLFPVNNGA
jgi:hypothetical protein